MGKTIVNYLPNQHFYRGINHSQMDGLWNCFTRIIPVVRCGYGHQLLPWHHLVGSIDFDLGFEITVFAALGKHV